MAKTNLCIVGLSKQFTDNICRQLSAKMDMFYASIEEIFAYDLVSVGEIEQVCGIDYLQREQRSIIRRVCGFDNTLINIEHTYLNDSEILKTVKDNCLLIYIALDANRYFIEQNNELISANQISINVDVFDDRDYLLRDASDLVVDCLKMDMTGIIDAVIIRILDYYSYI